MSKKNIKKIAVLTSGGDSPGMNAAIRAVVRTASFHKIKTIGVERGYAGLINYDFIELCATDVAQIINRGGTILKTGRCPEFCEPLGRQKAATNLRKANIDALVVIGGDGSLAGAHLLGKLIDIPIVGIPGTIDNDIVGTNYTIGFDTAVNTAVEAIDKIRDTADAFNRLFLVEVMGRSAGNIALNSGISCGAEAIFIPEKITDVEEVLQVIKVREHREKNIHIIVVAEGDKFGVKVLAQVIQQRFNNIDVRICCLGHIQRGGSPTQHDRVQASRFGYEAVLAIINGATDVMIGLLHREIVFHPLAAIKTKSEPLDAHWTEMLKVLSS